MSHQLPLEVRFLKHYAKLLQGAGIPAHQCERVVAALGRKLGFNCQVMSSPTALFLSFSYKDDEDDHRPIPMQLLRMEPPTINLGNYESLKIHVTIHVPSIVSEEEIEGNYEFCKGWTEMKMAEVTKEYTEEEEDDIPF